jgi:acetyl-CoA carboxylase carboxyltransferase component
LLGRFLDDVPREVVPGWCPRVRLFVGTRRGRAVGIFVNPLERSDNMINVRTLDKYAAGLDLFRALRLPIISVLDSPGIDPRFDQGDAGNIRRIVAVGEKIIRYPHGAMGVVAGRCFGGATTLAFPRVFGGRRAVALRDAQIGVMDDRIVGQVLAASPRLLAQWKDSVAARGREFADLVAERSLDAVIDPEALTAEVDQFLLLTGGSSGAVPFRLMEVV